MEIVRAIWRREKPLEHRGEYYQIPYRGPKATGLGKPLKSILHGRPDLPIYLAAMGPKAVELAAEIGDGILLVVWYSPYRPELHREPIRAGLGKKEGAGDLTQFDVVVTVRTAVTEDIPAALAPVKRMLAWYIGGTGARGKNSYNDLACRFGFEEDAKKVQDLYLDGKVAEAIAAVPDRLADDVALVGPKERLRDRACGMARELSVPRIRPPDPLTRMAIQDGGRGLRRPGRLPARLGERSQPIRMSDPSTTRTPPQRIRYRRPRPVRGRARWLQRN